MKQWKSIRMES